MEVLIGIACFVAFGVGVYFLFRGKRGAALKDEVSQTVDKMKDKL